MEFIKKYIIPLLMLFAASLNSYTQELPDNFNNLLFIENKGQLKNTDGIPADEVNYYAKAGDIRLYFTDKNISVVTVKIDSGDKATIFRKDMDMELITDFELQPEDFTESSLNFYYPHCPQGITNVRTFRKLTASLHGMADIEFSLPEKNTLKIKMSVSLKSENIGILSEIKKMLSNDGGILEIEEIPMWEMTTRLNADAEKLDKLMKIENPLLLGHETMDFEANVHWSTFFGGSEGETAADLALDATNKVYITGFSVSGDFPVSEGAHQKNWRGGFDAVIANFDALGMMRWATYYGGTETDYTQGICLDEYQNSYISGFTWSTDLPVTPDAFQQTHAGGINDGFILKLDRSGALVFCTYYGGNGQEHFYGIDYNGIDEIAVTGFTMSNDFPITDLDLPPSGEEASDAFLIRMTTDGRQRWASYFAGDSLDEAYSVVYQWPNEIAISGNTTSKDMPVKSMGNYNRKLPKLNDLFVAKWVTTQDDATLTHCKLYGGQLNDRWAHITIDSSHSLIVVASTKSLDFPMRQDPYQPGLKGNNDVVIMKLQDNFDIEWSTFFGGSRSDVAEDIATDDYHNIYICGSTESADFPLSNLASQKTLQGKKDAFAAKLTPDGKEITWSTFIGGSDDDVARGIGGDKFLNGVITGGTLSPDFPVTSLAYQGDHAGVQDIFLAKICATEPEVDIAILGDIPFCAGDSVSIVASDGFVRYIWSDEQRGQKITVKNEGWYHVTVIDTGGCVGVSDSIFVPVYPEIQYNILGDEGFCENDSARIEIDGGFASIEWDHGPAEKEIYVNLPGTYVFELTDEYGCKTMDSVDIVEYDNPEPHIRGSEQVCAYSTSSKYFITGRPDYSFEWEAEGGDINFGEDMVNIHIDWGGTGDGKIMVKSTNLVTGCVGYDTVYVKILEELKPEIQSNTGEFEFCEGSSLILSTENVYDRYEWLPGGSDQKDYTITEQGEYIVHVIDDAGCEGWDTVFVNMNPAPEPEISGKQSICTGDEIYIYNSELTIGNEYEWQVTGGDIIDGPGTNEISVRWAGAGSKEIYLTETDPETGCETKTDAFDITVHPLPEPEVYPDIDVIELCRGDSLEIYTNEIFDTYLWNNGADGPRTYIHESGEYWVEVTDENGCRGFSDTVNVVVHPLPQKPSVIRIADSLFSSVDAQSYQWFLEGSAIAAANEKKYVPSETGNYSVRITDENGCTSESDEFYIWRGMAVAYVDMPDTVFVFTGEKFSIPLNIVSSQNLTLVGAESFTAHIRYNRSMLLPVWTSSYDPVNTREEVASMSGSMNDTLGLLADIEFISALGDAPCRPVVLDSIIWNDNRIETKTDSTIVCLKELCEAGGTRLFSETGELFLMQNRPNPFSGNTYIEFGLIEKGFTEVFIIDPTGRRIETVFSDFAEPGEYEANFTTGQLPSGVYFYVLKTPTQKIIRKMEILK